MSGECDRHGGGVGLPRRRRPLDVGQQEGHRAHDGRNRLGRRDFQCAVLRDDSGLQAAKIRSGINPQFLGEHGTRPLVRAERVALPAGAVEGEHQLRPTPFPQRRVNDG